MSEQSLGETSLSRLIQRLLNKRTQLQEKPKVGDVTSQETDISILEEKHFQLIKVLRALAQAEEAHLDVNQVLELDRSAHNLARELNLDINFRRLVRYDETTHDIVQGHKADPEKAELKREVVPSIGRGCLMEIGDPQKGLDFNIFDFDSPNDLSFIQRNQDAIKHALSRRISYKLPVQPVILITGKPLSHIH